MPSPIEVGQHPAGITWTLDGSKAYVANSNDSTLSVIDTATYTVLSTPSVDATPVAVTTNPVTGEVYVLWSGGIDYVDPSTDMVVNSLSGLLSPASVLGFAVDPTGATLYVADYNSFKVVDIASATITSSVTTGVWSGGSANVLCLNGTGTTAYVLTADGHVYPIDIGTLTIGSPETVGSHTSTNDMALTPDGTTLAVTTSVDGDLCLLNTTTWTPTDIALGAGVTNSAVAIDGTGINAYTNDSSTNAIIQVPIASPTPVVLTYDSTQPDGLFVNPSASELWVTEIFGFFPDGSVTPFSIASATELTADIATVDIDAAAPTLSFVDLVYLTADTATVTIDATPPVLSLPTIADAAVTTFVLAGNPGPRGYGSVFTPLPPNPQPGPFGSHEYEIVVCDKYGIAYGVMEHAVVTQIDYELDGIGQATIDFPVMNGQDALLLPMSDIPGVREVQIWRDQVLIWWGWPTSATWDNVQVHLTCSGLLWPLSRREFGPPFIHLLTNPQFEEGLTGWTAENCTAAAQSTTVALGTQAAQLFQPTTLEDAFLRATVVVDLSAGGDGYAFALSGWYYIDTTYAFTGPALDNRGLFWEDDVGNFGFAQIDNSTPLDTWTRIELSGTPAFIAAGGRVTTYDIRLYCPGGSIVWDDIQLDVYENVSSPPGSPPATAWDVTDICQAIVESAQNPQWSKSDLALDFYGAPTGVLLNRVYEVSDNEVILDALNEFPQIGVCDFEVVWDDTGHFRGFQVFGPAKGSIKYNAVINIDVNTTTAASGQVDGTQVGTTQRVLGQGSSGPANDTGYAQFASYLGGRTVDDGSATIGDYTVNSATADFTSDDLGQLLYCLEGNLSPGSVIVAIISSTEVQVSEPVLVTGSDLTLGVGGITLDTSTSAIQDQPISTLQKSATSLLIQQMKAQALPNPKMRADGPNGLFGQITVGDVVMVSADFGWVQIDPQMMRVAKLTLYPPTEELEPTLMPVNALPSPS